MPGTAGPRLTPDAGPDHAPSGTPHTGLWPGQVWRYELGTQPGTLPVVPSFVVDPAVTIQLAIFPELGPGFDACRAGVVGLPREQSGDRMIVVRDQHRHDLVPGRLGCLVADQWNLLALDLTASAGRTLDRIDLALPAGTGRGWLQARRVPDRGEPDDIVGRVDMRRGANSGFAFSRGSTFPAVCLPGGFVLCTPVTDARTDAWLYRWSHGGPEPRLQGFSLAHEPSPWMRDRSACQVMPWFGMPRADPRDRALAFDHDVEAARPDRYQVLLRDPAPTGQVANRVLATLVPTTHGAVMSFAFDGPLRMRGVLLDQPGDADLDLDPLPDGRVAIRWWLRSPDGHLSGPGAPTSPVPGAWVYGETMQPAAIWPDDRPGPLRRLFRRPAHDSGRPRALWLRDGLQLEIRLAQSHIGIAQAKHTFELELAGRSQGEVTAAAHQAWEHLLGRLEITGGTREQRTAAWSGLARVLMWPSAHHENAGSSDHPRWVYASPYHRRLRPDDAELGGLPTGEGRLMVNNGYWDTYRTAWPLYHLLAPELASGLLDGITQAYRDSGWMSRWAAPGHQDCMVGTSSDAVGADAAAHRLAFDEQSFLDSALRDCLVPSEDPRTGRKGLARGRFAGWIDRDTPEGFSWSIENANCDAAVALWTARLSAGGGARATEYSACAAYLANRALAWRCLWDPATGFLRGRDASGGFGEHFDPLDWGGDYAETDAWGMAFSVVWDGAGLADALGGPDALAARLDEARATPENADHPGAYGGIIHEMAEARALRLGQFGVSNQPAHHTPFMYLHAGRPDATQALVRELCDRVFVGSEIGQGYPGDEDNGEMSAWQLFCLMGLYPLQVGSGQFVLTTPTFDEVAWRRPDGTRLCVRAHGDGDYIASVSLDGRPWDEVWIDVATLHRDCTIEVERSTIPTGWGRSSRPLSLSRLAGRPAGGRFPPLPPDSPGRAWQPDRSGSAHLVGGPASLVDDTGATAWTLTAGAVIELAWDEPFVPLCATVTFAAVPGGDAWHLDVHGPSGWARAADPVMPRWPGQTTPQALPERQIDRVRLVGDVDLDLLQLEVF